MTSTAITPIEYSGLQEAYDHFNSELFEGALVDVFVTYQRKARSDGYFASNRFASRHTESPRHELALNPDGFLGCSDKQIVQTLVHEMCHVWQHQYGDPSGGGYHNREWSAKMKTSGLYPSSTGMPGGRETGHSMSDYIIPGDRFDQSYDKLAATGWRLNLESAPRAGVPGNTNSKTKFTCEQCQQNAWGKPNLFVICGLCGSIMTTKKKQVGEENFGAEKAAV
jgi:hypothetical protein